MTSPGPPACRTQRAKRFRLATFLSRTRFAWPRMLGQTPVPSTWRRFAQALREKRGNDHQANQAEHCQNEERPSNHLRYSRLKIAHVLFMATPLLQGSAPAVNKISLRAKARRLQTADPQPFRSYLEERMRVSPSFNWISATVFWIVALRRDGSEKGSTPQDKWTVFFPRRIEARRTRQPFPRE